MIGVEVDGRGPGEGGGEMGGGDGDVGRGGVTVGGKASRGVGVEGDEWIEIDGRRDVVAAIVI